MTQFCYLSFIYEGSFLSPVATDGKDGHGLKLEKIGKF